MNSKTNKKNEFLTYKGKPLVRCKETIYYGNIYDKYVIKMQVKSSKKVEGLDISDKVIVKLVDTEKNKAVKTSEKSGLYLALDIAEVWLRRALEEKVED